MVANLRETVFVCVGAMENNNSEAGLLFLMCAKGTAEWTRERTIVRLDLFSNRSRLVMTATTKS